MTHQTTFKGAPLKLEGTPLSESSVFPTITLVNTELGEVKTTDLLGGKVTVILSVPSLDTPVCSTEVRTFNQRATGLGEKVQVVAVSKDLPFAQKRWCGAEGVSRVTCLSDYKYDQFGKNTATYIKDWGLLSRAVFVIGPDQKLTYIHYVPEIASEPPYEEVLKACAELVG
jgi:thioredoxin-dependent peroxiredoxin